MAATSALLPATACRPRNKVIASEPAPAIAHARITALISCVSRSIPHRHRHRHRDDGE
jgi:hypothetical protein